MARKIICIKLNTAEDLIAYVKESSSLLTNASPLNPFDGETPWSLPIGETFLEKVRVISLQNAGQGRVAMVLMPWSLGDIDASLKIDLSKQALVVYPPTKNLEDEYMAQTTSITLAGALTGQTRQQH